MNVFVIPSWYPSACQPIAGLFVRDQAEAVALHRPDWNVVVGTWGHHDGALSLRSPGASLRALRWRQRRGSDSRWSTAGPMQVVQTPALSWTLAIAGGGAAGLLRASRCNFAQARQRFGRLDVMHAHVGFPAGWIAACLSVETGVPYVLTEHMGPFPFAALRTRSGAVWPALRQAFDRAGATIAVSDALAQQLRDCGLPCSHVIPNVVDEQRFRPVVAAATATATATARPFVFFTLGALTPQKGVDLLLRALARWNPPRGEVELRIGGSGPLLSAHRALAAGLGIADRVRWLGAVAPEAAPGHFAACDAFVLASRHESFGVVLVEALMSGKPVIATRSGGPQTIVEADNGVLVDVGDVAGLAGAMSQLAAQPGRFDAATIRSGALGRFSRAAVATQLVAVYESVHSA